MDPTVRRFQRAIIDAATAKLRRSLTAEELRFITCRGGFLALEMIQDTVEASSPEDVQRYLNSEATQAEAP
jgi:hypothetical protein